MSTNCLIAREKDNGGYECIYTHWDGYPEWVGQVLHDHYLGNEDKIDRLFSLGDLSSLGYEVEPPEGELHSFEEPLEGVTVAYCRDRGETLQPAQPLGAFNKGGSIGFTTGGNITCGAEFLYLIKEDDVEVYVPIYYPEMERVVFTFYGRMTGDGVRVEWKM